MRTLFVAFVATAFLTLTGCTSLDGRRFDPQFRLFAPPEGGKSVTKTVDNTRESSGPVARPQAPLSRTSLLESQASEFASGARRGSDPPFAGGSFPNDPLPPATGRSTWDGVIPDQHTRTTPTVTGRTLALNPAENGTDRAVELAHKIEQLQAENKALQSRIATLEQNATLREESIAESLREVEAATVEVIRAKNELKTSKKAVQALKDQIRTMEREEIETLKTIVTELEKLLDEKE